MSASAGSRYIRSMRFRCVDPDFAHSQLKRLVADMCGLHILVPGDIADNAPLTGGTFDLDSFDMIELAILVEEEFGIAIRSGGEARSAFRSISSLADFICIQTQIGLERPLPEVERSDGGKGSRLAAGPFAWRSIA